MAERTYDLDADRMMWGDDGGPYAAPPRFSVHSTAAIESRLVCEAKAEAETVRIHANRLTSKLDSVLAHKITDDRMQDIVASARDAVCALQDALAKLARAA